MSAPAAVPTLDAVTAQRARAQAELAELQRELAAIPGQIEQLDERIAATGDHAASQEQAALRIRARQLPKWIASYEAAVQKDLAAEQQLREAACAAQVQREDDADERAFATEMATMWAGIDAATAAAGRGRVILKRLTARKAGGDRERQRQEMAMRCGGATFTVIGETLGARSEERRVGKECRSRWSPYH